MLHKAKTLNGYKLDSLDGEIGTVRDFLFDDRHGTIRYLVGKTGNWLSDRQALISPYSLVNAIEEERQIVIDLTKQQIENSPALRSDLPVSRQFEEDYYGYYGMPMYWGGDFAWGIFPSIVRDHAQWKEHAHERRASDSNLRSTHDVDGHHIHATDGDIGHVVDFVIDDETWAIRYLIVDSRNWWRGKKVLVSPIWIESVSWRESKVYVNLSREAVRRSPEFMEDSLITREYEGDLHRHYNRQEYWATEPGHSVHFQ